jgi:hypothetical protein
MRDWDDIAAQVTAGVGVRARYDLSRAGTVYWQMRLRSAATRTAHHDFESVAAA